MVGEGKEGKMGYVDHKALSLEPKVEALDLNLVYTWHSAMN
jgi:hypothetical protein